MNSLLLEFADSMLTREEMKSIQGGYGEGTCKSCKYLMQGYYETAACTVPPNKKDCMCTKGLGTENCTVS